MLTTQSPLTAAGYQVSTQIGDYLDGNENGDAELFAALYSNRVVYDHQAGEWNLWRGSFWERDRTREIYSCVFDGVANEYLEAAKHATDRTKRDLTDRARYLLTKKRADSILYLASTKDAIKITGREWDADPLILGVNNGVIDLRTGEFRTGKPSEYIRSHAPADWQGLDTPCPTWEKALQDIFTDDADMSSFIHRLFGYAITGQTIEHILPIFWGEGRNGKSTILETLAAVLGADICMTTQADSLMETRRDGDAPQPFIYALRGKRLAWATESKEGQKINTGLIKQLTGGDSIRTRTLFQKDTLEFQPTHKVMLITNHKPHIPADDQAAWDRVTLIEFRTRFVDNPTAPNERAKDKNIKAKLLAESAGILAWLVRGCLEWQREGLNPPASVKDATQAYRDDEDTIGLFLEECCLTGAGYSAQSADLFKRYQVWAENYGLKPMNMQAFGRRMVGKFGKPTRKGSGNFYDGIGLLQTQASFQGNV